MKKMFIYNLMDMSVIKRLEVSLMISDYGYCWSKDSDFGNETSFKNFTNDDIKEFLSSYDLVIINNGYRKPQENFRKITKELNKKTIFTELGHLPQRGNLHLDYNGLYHEDSLCFDSLDWVTENDINLCKNYLNNSIYAQFLSEQKKDYILCPFQLDFDSSLAKSKLTNIDLINFVLQKYRSERIIFKFHPLHKEEYKKNIISSYQNIEIAEDQSFLELAKNAKKIVGMSSTCIVEALALNKEVEAIAECPIYFAIKNGKIENFEYRQKLLTAYFLTQYKHNDIKDAKRCVELLIKRSGYQFF